MEARPIIEQTADESVFADDIGAELEIKRFQKEKDELLKSLQLWYMIYRSEQGQIVKEIVLMQSKGLELEDILDEIEAKYGEEARVFAEQVLD